MRFASSLQGRLAATYAVVLLVGLCAFSAVTAFFLVQLSYGVLDARLRGTANAMTAIALDAGPQLALDAGDAAQFARVITPRLDGALVRADGSIAMTTASVVPAEVLAALGSAPRGVDLRTLSAGSDQLRVALSRVEIDGQTAGAVAVWSSTQQLKDFKRLLALVFGVGIPVVVGVGMLFAGFVARRGLAPLTGIARLATDIEAHDLSRRLASASSDDELGSLAATLNRMLDRLQAAFERQRRFTADASHELRAPLAVIRAEADLALLRAREPGEYRAAIESIAAEADRLEALIGDLLALARAESAPPSQSETVDFGRLVDAAAKRLGAVAAQRGVRIEVDVAPDVRVRGDRTALARVPLALLDNAVKYGVEGGAVRAALSGDGGEARLCVYNDGAGFTEEGLGRATDRFWRDDQVRGRSGSGLGLSIVRAIVERCGGTLALRNPAGGGAEVLVRLPQVSERAG